jgi:hypothetical protein
LGGTTLLSSKKGGDRMEVILTVLGLLEAVFKTLAELLKMLTSWSENQLSAHRGIPRHLKKRAELSSLSAP